MISRKYGTIKNPVWLKILATIIICWTCLTFIYLIFYSQPFEPIPEDEDYVYFPDYLSYHKIIEQKPKTQGIASWYSITGYCLKGVMASGKQVYNGAIACPTFMKLGTKIKIQGQEYICEDRMAKKYRNGNFIDKWYSSCSDALKWGRKKLLLTME